MKWILALFLSVTMLNLAAQAEAEVSTEEVEQMLQKMVKENVISAEEAEKAKFKMKTMNTSQWSKMNHQASSVAATRRPASVDLENASISKDLDGDQFKQIQNDIQKIMPKN